MRDCRAPVVKARYPVFCATAFTAAFSLAVVVLTASAAPGAASPVTLRIQGQGIVTVGTRSIHCISASATQIVCTGRVAVRRGRYVALRERPKAGWTFSTWGGACRGSASACRVRVVRPLRVGATFIPTRHRQGGSARPHIRRAGDELLPQQQALLPQPKPRPG